MSSPSVSRAGVPALPAAAAPSRSPLYRDALSSVLSFLSLRGLAAALAVNKEWNVAVRSMRPAMLAARISLPLLYELLSSRLRRHVGGLLQPQQEHTTWSLHVSYLPLLSDTLPRLHSLCVSLDDFSSGASLPFPPRLQCLQLRLWASPDKASGTALLAAISQLQQLHTLRLDLRDEEVSLAPLQRLPLLRDLELRASFPNAAQFAAELRALPWLHRLHIEEPFHMETKAFRVTLFTALLHDATEEELCGLQWRDFSLVDVLLTDELTPLLLRLPRVERLQVYLPHCTRFDFLSALPQLLHLEIDLWDMKDAVWADVLAVFASDALVRLHTLALRCDPGRHSSDDLVLLLSHTPSLTNFTLDRVRLVGSLSFFRQLPKLAETLSHLTVVCAAWCPLTAADLSPLLALRQLRELRLLEWASREHDAGTEEDRAPFEQLACTVLPQLDLFEWTTAAQCG
jgi:hypothetical protein